MLQSIATCLPLSVGLSALINKINNLKKNNLFPEMEMWLHFTIFFLFRSYQFKRRPQNVIEMHTGKGLYTSPT